MGSVKQLNSKAEVMGKSAALFMNINASKGLHEVMKSNLGPKGTIKMLVGGSGGRLISLDMHTWHRVHEQKHTNYYNEILHTRNGSPADRDPAWSLKGQILQISS